MALGQEKLGDVAAAVMLGVALAFSVHLINASALGEFSSAVRAVNGQPDLELRGVQGTLDESLFGRVATHPQVALASPVLELATYAIGTDRKRLPVRVVGVDALTVAAMAPALMPLPAPGADRLALLAPATVFLNPAAMAALVPGGLPSVGSAPSLQLQSALALRAVTVAGTVNAPGAALVVMDIGAAQVLFGAAGRLSRIDLRLQPGTDRAAFIAALQLPAGVTAGEPGDAAERVSNLSRAYRVNLTVLALVALFTGAFLVFSVLSLSVARRAQQFALLGVLGLTPLQRLRLVLVESLLLGAAGSAAGIALGTALAALALRLLGGDLGGGFFAGVAPPLQWEGAAALLYGLLGVAAAGVGGWWPARAAQNLPPAQTLKGLGAALHTGQHRAVPLLLIAAGVLLAQTPPVAGIPLAAYVSVGLLLVGGITALPWLIGLAYDRLAPWVSRRLLPLLAVERARRVRESAAVAVSGVVASLSLAVALTVMVASFRDSVTHWLDVVLPADLYVRAAMGTGAADTVYFPPELVREVARLPGVKRLATQRFVPLQLDPARPAVALISLYLRSGQAAKAVATAEGLTRQQPGNPSYLNLLGLAHAQAGNLAAARTAFEQAVKLDDSLVSARLNLARLDVQARSYDAAVAKLAAILKVDEKNTEAMLETGLLAERRGQLAEAQRWLEKANDLAAPRELRWGLALTDFHLRNNQAAAALTVAKTLVTKAPEDLLVLFALTRSFLANGDAAGARSSLSTATRVADYNPSLQVQIATLQLAAQNVGGAAYSLEKALSSRPDFLPALALMTDVELRQNEPAKAEKRALAIIAKHPKRAIGYSLTRWTALTRYVQDGRMMWSVCGSALPSAPPGHLLCLFSVVECRLSL